MRKMNGKVLLALGVMVALSITGGIIYAWTPEETFDGIKTTDGLKIGGSNARGIGMEIDPPQNEQMIQWEKEQYIKGKYDNPDKILEVMANAKEVGKYGWLELYAHNDWNTDISYHNERALMEGGPDGTAIAAWERDSQDSWNWKLEAEVRVDYDSNASMWSDSGAEVRAEGDGDASMESSGGSSVVCASGGDVVITLNN